MSQVRGVWRGGERPLRVTCQRAPAGTSDVQKPNSRRSGHGCVPSGRTVARRWSSLRKQGVQDFEIEVLETAPGVVVEERYAAIFKVAAQPAAYHGRSLPHSSRCHWTSVSRNCTAGRLGFHLRERLRTRRPARMRSKHHKST